MSNRIKELREKQATIVTEARERLDQINTATDETRAKARGLLRALDAEAS